MIAFVVAQQPLAAGKPDESGGAIPIAPSVRSQVWK
jgi:hypothetical protein